MLYGALLIHRLLNFAFIPDDSVIFLSDALDHGSCHMYQYIEQHMPRLDFYHSEKINTRDWIKDTR